MSLCGKVCFGLAAVFFNKVPATGEENTGICFPNAVQTTAFYIYTAGGLGLKAMGNALSAVTSAILRDTAI